MFLSMYDLQDILKLEIGLYRYFALPSIVRFKHSNITKHRYYCNKSRIASYYFYNIMYTFYDDEFGKTDSSLAVHNS